MIFGERCHDPFWRQSIRVSMGTIFRLPLIHSQDLLRDLKRTLKEGDTWTIEAPVDLPEIPLAGSRYEPMKSQLIYTVKKSEVLEGKPCVQLGVKGEFARQGLAIPIRQEEMKYLIWTTMLTRLEDQVEGEFIFDLENKVVRSSEIRSTYRFTTMAGRKVDNYRGRIESDHVFQARLTCKLTSTPPASIPIQSQPSRAANGQHETMERLEPKRSPQSKLNF